MSNFPDRPVAPSGGPLSSLLTLERSENKKIAGVCGALAARYRIDPTLVRVLFAVLALSAGIGALLYAVGWLVMPAKGQRSILVKTIPAAADWDETTITVIVALVCLLGTAVLGSLAPFGLTPAIVIGIVVFLAHRANRRREVSLDAERPVPEHLLPTTAPALPVAASAAPATEFDHAVAAWNARMASVEDGTAFDLYGVESPAPTSAVNPSQPLRTPKPRRRGAWSWTYGVIAMAFSWTAYAITHSSIDDQPRATTLAAVAGLAVAAAFLLIGAFTRAPRMGVLNGVILSGVLAVSLLAPAPGGPREVRIAWTEQQQIVQTVELSQQAGELDLSGLTLTESATVTINVKAGAAQIITPKLVPVTVHAKVRGGAFGVPDQGTAGISDMTWQNGVTGGPTLTLIVNITGGAVTVK